MMAGIKVETTVANVLIVTVALHSSPANHCGRHLLHFGEDYEKHPRFAVT